MFTVFADKAHWLAAHPGTTGDDLYAALFEDMSSRFDLYLRRRHAEGAPSKGVVIADRHDKSKTPLSTALKNYHRLHQRHGNRWGRLYNLIETVFLLDSHESPGLQFADLAAHAVWRLLAGDTDIARRIGPLFDREPVYSRVDPGKWHGVKYLGTNPDVRKWVADVWAP